MLFCGDYILEMFKQIRFKLTYIKITRTKSLEIRKFESFETNFTL